MLIEVKDVSFSYEKTLVLQNVDFSAKQGEFIAIFGPNGGGKTTLLKLLLGFLKPSSGSVHLACRQEEIGYVPQSAQFDKQFPISVLEVVLQGCLSELSPWGFFRAKSKKKAREALARVGAADLEKQAFGTLSGGQAQRVLIARAIVSHPKLLLLDEPTASIDVEAEAAIYDLLKDLHKSMTILMVTHDLQAVVGRVERLLCIQRRLTSFSPAQVCEHFAMGLYHPPLIRIPK